MHFKSLVIVVAVAYLAICLLMFIFQKSFVYFPDKSLKAFSKYRLQGFKEINLTTSDGKRIVSWYKPPIRKSPTIVFFHGNSGNLSYRIQKFIALTDKTGYGLLAVDYRGYGRSDGSPSEKGIYLDAESAIDYLLKNGAKEKDIVLYGESLGTGVAIQTALKYKALKAVILEAPFTSLPALGQKEYRFLPVKLLALER